VPRLYPFRSPTIGNLRSAPSSDVTSSTANLRFVIVRNLGRAPVTVTNAGLRMPGGQQFGTIGGDGFTQKLPITIAAGGAPAELIYRAAPIVAGVQSVIEVLGRRSEPVVLARVELGSGGTAERSIPRTRRGSHRGSTSATISRRHRTPGSRPSRCARRSTRRSPVPGTNCGRCRTKRWEQPSPSPIATTAAPRRTHSPPYEATVRPLRRDRAWRPRT
jgi:hypothetical protein